MEIALAVVKRFGVSTKRAHLDSSSFCVQGEYLNSQQETPETEIRAIEQSNQDSAKSEEEESAEPLPIEITHGYSRDHRPDLKQYTLDLITSGDGDVPLYLRVGNGFG
jgi:transposase